MKTTTKGRTALPLALALAALFLAMSAQLAGATHPRPKGATPVQVPLVPAYNPCTAPNRMHGPPLASPSCNPPAQASSFLTVGTPDANGAVANSQGYAQLKVFPGAFENVVIGARMSDVRCRPGSGVTACGNANSEGGPDYVGELEGEATIRITDHFNAVDPGGGNDPATLVDIPLPFNLYCTNTADTAIGGDCNINLYCPLPDGCSSVRDGDRTVVGITQIRVFDGGPDGIVATDDNTLFAVQGVFVP
jgi:hypothetical protein